MTVLDALTPLLLLLSAGAAAVLLIWFAARRRRSCSWTILTMRRVCEPWQIL